jgi:hypothetical protein
MLSESLPASAFPKKVANTTATVGQVAQSV